jgi:membrane protease YdiL (CAAX protease family)
VNTLVILRLIPSWGWDITFLKETPHAQVPVLIMVPWFISVIALLVELNFRGFLLGRLAALESSMWRRPMLRRLSPLALLTSALVFAFDPFMVTTFQHLHGIALWDGLVWGLLWLFTRNLYATIVAHAVEVILVYSAVRAALM